MPNITAKINVNTASGPQQVSVALPSAQAAQNSSLQLKLLDICFILRWYI